MSWGDLYLYMIQSVAKKRSIVRTDFLWKRWSGRPAETWVVIPAAHGVVTQGAGPVHKVLLILKHFTKTDDSYSYFGVLK
jgi:hypothetical protein